MVKWTRHSPIQTRRDAWVEVNLGALERNTKAIRRMIPHQVRLMAIVKADAYGHGASMIIPTLEASGVHMVGVAAMDEAILLRKAGHTIPVLVIGATPDWAVQTAIDYDIQLTVFDAHHLAALRDACKGVKTPVKVHIKVDTGMHRIGIDYRQAIPFIEACQAAPFLKVEGIFSHLACAEDPEFSQVQQERWQAIVEQLETKPPYIHLANTEGCFSAEANWFNMVRVGMGLYGYHPSRLNPPMQLEPVMGLKARVVHLQDVPPGEGVSYGHRYKTPEGRTTRIATLPLGYADGIPRALSGKIEGLYHGHRCRQIGTITMDQLMMDVSDLPDIQIGDTITLLGTDAGSDSNQAISLTDWATAMGTIEYELMCGLRVRLPKTYTR
jgi:alanine racemase